MILEHFRKVLILLEYRDRKQSFWCLFITTNQAKLCLLLYIILRESFVIMHYHYFLFVFPFTLLCTHYTHICFYFPSKVCLEEIPMCDKITHCIFTSDFFTSDLFGRRDTNLNLTMGISQWNLKQDFTHNIPPLRP